MESIDLDVYVHSFLAWTRMCKKCTPVNDDKEFPFECSLNAPKEIASLTNRTSNIFKTKTMDLPRVGQLVERNIEGVWFQAVVREVDKRRLLLQLCYTDDGNIEDGVHIDELREVSSHEDKDWDSKSSSEGKQGEGKDDKDYDKRQSSCVKKDATLPKPLAGLIEDDYEIRTNHIPTVTIHQNLDTEEAIIINGSESKLAAGGGLRALRYLKN